MRTLACLAVLVTAGCVTIEDKGLNEDRILTLELERWGQKRGVVEWPAWARQMKVPLDARPVSVRNVDCDWQHSLEYFDCEYDVEWTSESEGKSGIFRRKSASFGADENGDWVEVIIVT